jgi:hypothetical protein
VQIHTNTPQRSHCPRWILGLVAAVQLGEEVFQELWVCVLQDGFAYQPHQVKLVMDIVHGQQMGSRRLLCCNVVDIGARDAQASLCRWTTARALAALFDGPKVFCVDGVADVQDSGRSNGIAEALCRLEEAHTAVIWILTAVRVGHTQSNMSAPSATETTKSSG